MYNFNGVDLNNIVVHNIGSKPLEEGVRLSKSELNIDEEVKELLLKYFLSPFKSEQFYNFHHETDLQLNEVFNFTTKIFENPVCFYEQSVNIAKHLYEQSTHAQIKPGEFYVVYFRECVVDGEVVDGIGLFKSENKDTYLRVYQRDENYQIDYENGINIKKLDKGCLIFNTEGEQGYKVSIVDTVNKNNEAQYWKEDFLNLKQREDNYYKTDNYMNVCKGFSEHVLIPENSVDRKEQIEFVKKSADFFKEKDEFDVEEFEQQVIAHPEVIEAFRDYKQEYEELNEVKVDDRFGISSSAFKAQKKNFRSVLKLDKNFHVYVHSNPKFMDKGYDEARGMKYYKLYFDHEE